MLLVVSLYSPVVLRIYVHFILVLSSVVVVSRRVVMIRRHAICYVSHCHSSNAKKLDGVKRIGRKIGLSWNFAEAGTILGTIVG